MLFPCRHGATFGGGHRLSLLKLIAGRKVRAEEKSHPHSIAKSMRSYMPKSRRTAKTEQTKPAKSAVSEAASVWRLLRMETAP